MSYIQSKADSPKLDQLSTRCRLINAKKINIEEVMLMSKNAELT